jgi:hypothetical protein
MRLLERGGDVELRHLRHLLQMSMSYRVQRVLPGLSDPVALATWLCWFDMSVSQRAQQSLRIHFHGHDHDRGEHANVQARGLGMIQWWCAESVVVFQACSVDWFGYSDA